MTELQEAQEEMAAHADLEALLDGVEEYYGRYWARTTARTLLAAVEQGRLDGNTYGRLDLAQGRVVACVLGYTELAVCGPENLGKTPTFKRSWNEEEDCQVGNLIESYVMNIQEGETPNTHPRVRNIHSWLTAYIGS